MGSTDRQHLAGSYLLPDPQTTFGPWLNLLQNHPRYWKRLVNRAVEHDTLQRDNEYMVRRYHEDCVALLEAHGTFSISRPTLEERETEELFGCLCCKLRCRSKAGERVHMFRTHGQVASHRVHFDSTSCPACLKEFHSFSRVSNHLRHQAACREVLKGRGVACQIVPGHGSIEDHRQEQQIKGLRYPQQGAGPHLPAARRVAEDDFHSDLHQRLSEILLDEQATDKAQALIAAAQELIVPWTKYVATLKAYYSHFSSEDAETSGVPRDELCHLLNQAIDLKHWSFLQAPCAQPEPTLMDLVDYEGWFAEVCAQETPTWTQQPQVPRPVGRERVLLHLYSGRRRQGDLQYYLDAITSQQDAYLLHVVSVDYIISKDWGDISKEATRTYWLHGAAQGWVIAAISGPPCNTWSKARSHQIQGHKRGPRPVRDATHLWGLLALSVRELRAVLDGNLFLGFSIQMLIVLYLNNGYGVLEHPSEPQEESFPSIWKLPIINLVLSLEGFEVVHVAQGLFGARSPKPTTLLAMHLPRLRKHLHSGRIAHTLPANGSIGLSGAGEFQTSSLKEYPPALCRALALAFSDHIAEVPSSEETSINAAFLARCKELTCTEYGDKTGHDFAH